MVALGGFWKKFLGLLPQQKQYIGTVASVGTLGRYTLTTDAGSVIRATSSESFTVGDKVFFTGSQIDGPAPTLTDLGTIEL